MKISTEYLKTFLVDKLSCGSKSIKRVSKAKNDLGQIVRKFATDKGTVVVVSNETDENIVSYDLLQPVENNGFYFCYAPKLTKEVKRECSDEKNLSVFLITPIEHYDSNEFLSDVWSPVLDELIGELFSESMSSVYEARMNRTEAELFLLSKGCIENTKMSKWDMLD